MKKSKHLSLSERFEIQHALDTGSSLTSIAKSLGRATSTISREILLRAQYRKTGCMGRAFNDCANKPGCTLTHLCAKQDCKKHHCCTCALCHAVCSHYRKVSCKLLTSPPYVCNGCKKRHGCTLEKCYYRAQLAHAGYEQTLSEARSGANITEEEANNLYSLLLPLVEKGQSFHAIYVNHKDEIMVDKRTLYRYVETQAIPIKAIDLPRKVRYKPRAKVKPLKVDKCCRIHRTWKDYLAYCKENPGVVAVEMDTVEGEKGQGPVLLSLIFPQVSLVLLFLRERNTSKSVITAFDRLYNALGHDHFNKLFSVIVTDNGSEFSNPRAIESTSDGLHRSRIFYCNPGASYQKPAIENIHTLLRRIIPKGNSFSLLTPEKVKLMQDHINSYVRSGLNGKSPHEAFTLLYGEEIAKKLGLHLVPHDEVTLTPSLIK